MATDEKPKARHAPVGGIILLFLGVLLLLQNLGILPWGLWHYLLWFWPVIIILVGLGIVFRYVNPWLTALLIVAVLGAVLGIAVWQNGLQVDIMPVNRVYSEPRGDIKRGQATLRFTAGDFNVGSLPPGSTDFVKAALDGNNADPGLQASLKRENGEARLSFEAQGFSRALIHIPGARGEVDLARDVPLTIATSGVMCNLTLDLKDLAVNGLDFDGVMGNYLIEMPSKAGTVSAGIKGTFSNLEIILPRDAAASISVNTAFGVSEVDESRFPQKGQGYASPDYDTATRKIDLKVDATFGRVNIK